MEIRGKGFPLSESVIFLKTYGIKPGGDRPPAF